MLNYLYSKKVKRELLSSHWLRYLIKWQWIKNTLARSHTNEWKKSISVISSSKQWNQSIIEIDFHTKLRFCVLNKIAKAAIFLYNSIIHRDTFCFDCRCVCASNQYWESVFCLYAQNHIEINSSVEANT